MQARALWRLATRRRTGGSGSGSAKGSSRTPVSRFVVISSDCASTKDGEKAAAVAKVERNSLRVFTICATYGLDAEQLGG